MEQRVKNLPNEVFTEYVNMVSMECPCCGIPYAVPAKWRDKKVEANGSFNCPNGCSLHFTGETQAQKLQKIVDRKNSELEEANNRMLDEINERKKVERKLKRVHNGTCPCCKRSFPNLQRHMQSKHPELIQPGLQTLTPMQPLIKTTGEMTQEEYDISKTELKEQYDDSLRLLDKKYALANNPYKIGDIFQDHIG